MRGPRARQCEGGAGRQAPPARTGGSHEPLRHAQCQGTEAGDDHHRHHPAEGELPPRHLATSSLAVGTGTHSQIRRPGAGRPGAGRPGARTPCHRYLAGGRAALVRAHVQVEPRAAPLHQAPSVQPVQLVPPVQLVQLVQLVHRGQTGPSGATSAQPSALPPRSALWPDKRMFGLPVSCTRTGVRCQVRHPATERRRLPNICLTEAPGAANIGPRRRASARHPACRAALAGRTEGAN